MTNVYYKNKIYVCLFVLFELEYQVKRKLLKMLYISLSAVFIKKVNNFNKTCLKHIEYAESEFRTFEYVICKFIVVYMNIK